jgi:protein involved in polysaccharide export with SLBB domain
MSVKSARLVRYAVRACTLAGLLTPGGCDFFKTDATRWLSPHQLIARPERSPISPILQSLSLADQYEERVPNSTLPQAEDYVYSDVDYVIGPSDIVRIAIMDLIENGLESQLERQVSDSGYIDLPLLEVRIKAEGLTKEELKQEVIRAYREADILPDAEVTVTLISKRQAVFSVLGAVASPNTFALIRKDMRLLEALALANDVTQPSIPYVYVIRQPRARPASEKKAPPEKPEKKGPPTGLPELPKIPPTTVPAEEELEKKLKEITEALNGGGSAAPEGEEPPRPSAMLHLSESGAAGSGGSASQARNADLRDSAKTYKWVYTNGRWIRVAIEPPVTKRPPTRAAPPEEAPPDERKTDPFGWAKISKRGLARIIAINLPRLKQGDPQMNIVIRDYDVVYVPPLEVGEFYVMGEVQRPGVYALTGRQLTIKQALAAAGNLSQLAWPENSVLIRRIGKNQEQVVPLNIEKIFRGEESDIFLRPNDVIAVGTDVRATFYAVMRNAFRMSYGFGFIYDRNFAEPVLPGLNSRRFSRW